MREPYQILAIPYRFIGDTPYYCVFHSTYDNIWQFVSGGGETGEKLAEAAKRKVRDVTGVEVEGVFMLKSLAYIPVTVVPESVRSHWDRNMYVIPECSFAFECYTDITLSKEYDEFMWVSYDEAVERLHYDSNVTALYELNCILLNQCSTLFNIIAEIPTKDYAISLTQLMNNINGVLLSTHNASIKLKTISDWLLKKGFFESYTTRFGNKRRRLTEYGKQIGIFTKFHFIKDKNFGYNMFLFKKEAQQFIIDNFDQILREEHKNLVLLKQPRRITEAKVPEIDELNILKKKQ